MEIKILSNSEKNTILLGKTISSFLKPKDVIALEGDLGCGKTTFTKGVALGLGVKSDINSPTFNIVKQYSFDSSILYHIDAYRLEGVDEKSNNIGLEEIIGEDGICIIEWPIYIASLIDNKKVLNISFKYLNDNEREIIIKSSNEDFQALFNALKEYKW